jgi:hypothetical protein
MRGSSRILLAAVSAGLGLAAPGVALAQEPPYPGSTPTTIPSSVLSSQETRGPVRASNETVEEESTEGTDGGLPVTGGDLVGLTAIGLGAIGVGTVVVRRNRRTA